MGYSKDKDQKRMKNNVQGTSLEVPEMVLLIKDNKTWSEESNKTVPSRPVVSGSRGINTDLSEWISEIMEPVAALMKSAEVCLTEEVLARFDKLNKDIELGVDTSIQDVLPDMCVIGKTKCNAAMGSKVVPRANDPPINKKLNYSLLIILDDLIMNNNNDNDNNNNKNKGL